MLKSKSAKLFLLILIIACTDISTTNAQNAACRKLLKDFPSDRENIKQVERVTKTKCANSYRLFDDILSLKEGLSAGLREITNTNYSYRERLDAGDVVISRYFESPRSIIQISNVDKGGSIQEYSVKEYFIDLADLAEIYGNQLVLGFDQSRSFSYIERTWLKNRYEVGIDFRQFFNVSSSPRAEATYKDVTDKRLILSVKKLRKGRWDINIEKIIVLETNPLN